MTQPCTLRTLARTALGVGVLLAGAALLADGPATQPAPKQVPVNQVLTGTLRYEIKILSLEMLGPSATFGTIVAKTNSKDLAVWVANITVAQERQAQQKGNTTETPIILDPTWFTIYANRPPQHKETARCSILGLVKDNTFGGTQYAGEKTFQWAGKIVFVGPDRPQRYYMTYLDSPVLEISGGKAAGTQPAP